MDLPNPLQKSKTQYQETINVIQSDASPVGIDPQYTHAIIIEFLKQISARLDRLETIMRCDKK